MTPRPWSSSAEGDEDTYQPKWQAVVFMTNPKKIWNIPYVLDYWPDPVVDDLLLLLDQHHGPTHVHEEESAHLASFTPWNSFI